MTIFYVNILPWIFSILIIILTFLFIIYKLDFLIGFNVFFIIILLDWWFFTKKLKIVYLSKKKLKVNNEIIPFDKIISVNKYIFSSTYRIKYMNEEEVKSFIFLPKFYLPFFTQSYIKEIKKDIKLRETKTT